MFKGQWDRIPYNLYPFFVRIQVRMGMREMEEDSIKA
jgi:hypothetical protein